MKTLKAKIEELNATGTVKITRHRSRRPGNFADANWRVTGRQGAARTLDDGALWDGWVVVGHYRDTADAVCAAEEFNNR